MLKNIKTLSGEVVLFVLGAAIKNMLIQLGGTCEHCFNESMMRSFQLIIQTDQKQNNERSTSSERPDPDFSQPRPPAAVLKRGSGRRRF